MKKYLLPAVVLVAVLGFVGLAVWRDHKVGQRLDGHDEQLASASQRMDGQGGDIIALRQAQGEQKKGLDALADRVTVQEQVNERQDAVFYDACCQFDTNGAWLDNEYAIDRPCLRITPNMRQPGGGVREETRDNAATKKKGDTITVVVCDGAIIKDRTEFREGLTTLRGRLAQLEGQVRELAQRAGTRRQIAQINSQIAGLRKQLADAENAHRESEVRLRQELADAKATAEAAKAAVARGVRVVTRIVSARVGSSGTVSIRQIRAPDSLSPGNEPGEGGAEALPPPPPADPAPAPQPEPPATEPPPTPPPSDGAPAEGNQAQASDQPVP